MHGDGDTTTWKIQGDPRRFERRPFDRREVIVAATILLIVTNFPRLRSKCRSSPCIFQVVTCIPQSEVLSVIGTTYTGTATVRHYIAALHDYDISWKVVHITNERAKFVMIFSVSAHSQFLEQHLKGVRKTPHPINYSPHGNLHKNKFVQDCIF